GDWASRTRRRRSARPSSRRSSANAAPTLGSSSRSRSARSSARTRGLARSRFSGSGTPTPDALFIGGGTGGGKTTTARALAARHGLRLLPIDAFWYEHAERAGETPPSPDVQWLAWSPATQAASFERVSRLMLGYVLEDLPSLPAQPAVLVE